MNITDAIAFINLLARLTNNQSHDGSFDFGLLGSGASDAWSCSCEPPTSPLLAKVRTHNKGCCTVQTGALLQRRLECTAPLVVLPCLCVV
jgi:hypothetical protein